MVERLRKNSVRKNGNNREIEKIMVATDGSLPSLLATKKAIKMARMYNATVYAVTIQEKAPMMPIEKMLEDLAEKKYRVIQSKGAEVAQIYGEMNGVRVITKKIVETPIVGALLRYADEIKPDLIMVGNSGRTGFEKIALGSVAESMVHHSEYPTMVSKVTDTTYLEDIIEIAKKHLAAIIEEEEKPVELLDIRELNLGKRLGLSFAVLIVFLVPYFGLGIITSFAHGLAMQKSLLGLTTALLWIFILFPIGWVVAIAYDRYARKFD